MVVNKADIIKELEDLLEMIKQDKVVVESLDIGSNPIYVSTLTSTKILVKTDFDVRVKGSIDV